MHIEELREYCLNKPQAEESMPFGEAALVFKVAGKIFALCRLETCPLLVNLKCDPQIAMQYRAAFEAIQPAYHMNKNHWNTVDFEGGLTEDFLKQLIDDSYDLVIKALSKQKRMELDL